MNKTLPIVIPFKETSNRCPNKNFVLFSYALKWLKDENISTSDIYVVSSSNKVKQLALDNKLNFFNEPIVENPNGDIAAYYVAKSIYAQQYVLFPLTQPVKSHGLILQMQNSLIESTNIDFVTTYQNFTDRSLFYINDNMQFLNQSYNRKGCMCKEMKMLDGALYCIRTSFMDNVVKTADINAAFWAGNFIAIKNDVDFFIDIDTKADMRKFSQLSANYFSL